MQDNFSEMKNYLKKIGSNRRLAAGRLEIDFKKPFDLLAKLPAEARGEAPSEATNSIWWTWGDLNPQPSRCHLAALPLRYRPEKRIFAINSNSSCILVKPALTTQTPL